MPIRPTIGLRTSPNRYDGDALIGNVNLHALSHGEARLLQPIAAQAEIGNLWRAWPAAMELIVVAGAGDTEQTWPEGGSTLSSHGGIPSRYFEFAIFEMAAGCSKPLEDGGRIPPFREYCISRTPDHRQQPPICQLARSMGTKKPLIFRVRRPLRERCFEHLPSTLARQGSRGQSVVLPNITLVPTRKSEALLRAPSMGMTLEVQVLLSSDHRG